MRPTEALTQREFIALMAMLMANVAFSIDAMLPAIPQIAAELSPDAPNRAQLVVTSFVLGLGIGTLFVGPLSDALGRKPVVLGGAVLFSLGAGLSAMAGSLDLLLAARVVQGLGAAAARVVAIAIIRDLHSGRQMAQITSLVIMVFSLVPAAAPAVGAGIIALTGWRGIFGAFLVFIVLVAGWLALRQPETLPPERRRPLNARALAAATREVLSNGMVRTAIAVQALCFGILFAMISTTQPVFDITFGRADEFPLWFALIALLAASAAFVNSRIVVRLGMRRVIRIALWGQIGFGGGFLATMLSGLAGDTVLFGAYLVWSLSVFAMAGLTLGNVSALALEPLGHIAGLAASVVTAIGTVSAAVIASLIGLTFDGTPVPVAIGTLVLAALALALMLALGERGEEMPVGI